MTSLPPQPRRPLQARPIRRAVHTLVALAGWVLFVYWWWLVFRRVSPTEIRFTLWFIAISFAAIVLVTGLWAIHNLRLFRGKPARTHLKLVQQDSSHDSIGRPVGMPAMPEECRTASLVVVRIEDGAKVYRPAIRHGTSPQQPPGAAAS